MKWDHNNFTFKNLHKIKGMKYLYWTETLEIKIGQNNGQKIKQKTKYMKNDKEYQHTQ